MLRIKIYPNNHHQVVAIPLKGKVADVFLDKLDKTVKAKYNKNIEDFIERVSFYDDKIGECQDFFSNLTPKTSKKNFNLMSFDEKNNFQINVFQHNTKKFNEALYFEYEKEFNL